MLVGRHDVFERLYTDKFKQFAGQFGEFAYYERDRAARDIGLQLTRKLHAGDEAVTSAFCWFQLKGYTRRRLPFDKFVQMEEIKYSLEVSHLVFWLAQPVPTYLVLYIESADIFLVLDIQKYIQETRGSEILSAGQREKTISIPRENYLQPEIFLEILFEEDIRLWMRLFGCNRREAWLCIREHRAIENLASSRRGDRELRLVIWDWINRSGKVQLFFEERAIDSSGGWRRFHIHSWLAFRACDVESEFVFLQCVQFVFDDWIEEEKDRIDYIELLNGDRVWGEDFGNIGEVYQYIVSIKISKKGMEMY